MSLMKQSFSNGWGPVKAKKEAKHGYINNILFSIYKRKSAKTFQKWAMISSVCQKMARLSFVPHFFKQEGWSPPIWVRYSFSMKLVPSEILAQQQGRMELESQVDEHVDALKLSQRIKIQDLLYINFSIWKFCQQLIHPTSWFLQSSAHLLLQQNQEFIIQQRPGDNSSYFDANFYFTCILKLAQLKTPVLGGGCSTDPERAGHQISTT